MSEAEIEILRQRISTIEGELIELRADIARMGGMLGAAGIKGFDERNESIGRPWRGVEDTARELRKKQGE